MAIKSFKHKGLEKFFYTGTLKGINAPHKDKLETRLDRLDAATNPQDMNLPGYGLHSLHKELAGHWAIKVSGAWRLTFAFEGSDAVLVDYVQYH